MRCILVNNLFNWIPQAFEKPLETVHTRDQRWIANRVYSYQNTRKNVLKMKIARLLWSAAREAVIWSALLLSIIQNVSYFNHEQLWNRKSKKISWVRPFRRSCLRRQPTFSDAPTGFHREMTSEKTSAEIPYWWCVTTQIRVMLLIGWSNQPLRRTT